MKSPFNSISQLLLFCLFAAVLLHMFLGHLVGHQHVKDEIADVFDALSSARCYKPAWPQDKVVAFFKENSGKQFDPQITQVLLDNLEQVEAIRDRHPDPSLEDTTAAAV